MCEVVPAAATNESGSYVCWSQRELRRSSGDGPGYAVVHLQGSEYDGAAGRTLCGVRSPALWYFDWSDVPPDEIACQRCRAAYQRRAVQGDPSS